MQDKRDDVVFGTSVVGGFNRKNVLNYIEKLQNRLSQSGAAADEKERLLRQAESARRDLQAQIEAMQAAFDETASTNRTLQTQLDAARIEARQVRAQAAELRARTSLWRKK